MNNLEHLQSSAWVNANYGIQTGMYGGGQISYGQYQYPVMSQDEVYNMYHHHRGDMQDQSVMTNYYASYPAPPSTFSSESSVSSAHLPLNIPNDKTKKKKPVHEKSKRSLDDYAWLVVIAEACHSDSQIASGMDLTNVKKKYKRMFCLVCAEHNPSSSWAHMKARKFEKDGLDEHEKSIHHKRALAAQSSSSSLSHQVHTTPLIPSLTTNQNIIVPSIQTTFPEPLIPSNRLPDDSYFPHQLLPTVETLTSGATILASMAPSAYPLPLNGNLPNLPFGHPSNALLSEALTKSAAIISSEMGAHRARPVYNPDWLHVGATITSATQKDVPGAKKKYRLLMCKCCAQYNDASPWATLRPRKYETAVLLEHEKSMFHKKAKNNARDQAGNQEQLTLFNNNTSSPNALHLSNHFFG